MATVVPPQSKRQKRAVLDTARTAQAPDVIPDGSVRVQFVDRSSGEQTGSTVSIPLQLSSMKHLELLLNSIQGVDAAHDRVPYRFFFTTSAAGGTITEDALGDNSDVYRALIKPGKISAEQVVRLEYVPQAVFRVKAVSRCVSAISGHDSAILATQFAPHSSRFFATGSGDNTARIWDADTNTPVHTLRGHTGWVLVIAWAPDGQFLATGSMDSTVRVWDGQTGAARPRPFTGHSKWITAIAWEPIHARTEENTVRLVSASKDSTLRIWDAVSGQCDMVLAGHKSSVTCVRWGGRGWIYSGSQDRTIRIWDASSGAVVHTLTGHAHWVNHLALSTDHVLRTGYFDPATQARENGKTSVVLSPAEQRALARSRFESSARTGGEIVERLVSASDDCTMFLWRPEEKTKPIGRMVGHQKQVNHVSFSPDGLWLVSAGFDNLVKMWDGRDGRFVATLKGHVGPVYQACFSSDSRLVVSASKDTTLKVWDVRTGKLSKDLPGHKDEVYAVDWSADGERVGSGGKDKQVRLWRH